MIVIEREDGLRLVTQPDHARIAAEILSLWRADGLPQHPRREDLLFAVREHDNGWRETDAAPRVTPNGRPHDFLDLPDELRREIWLRAIGRFADERPGAAALIARHALAIHRDRRADGAWREFFAAVEDRLAELSEAATLGPAELDADYRWLRLADGVSLRACGALDDAFDDGGLRLRRTAAELTLDPFPLAGATTFAVPCRHIPDRPYATDTDLTLELATARWTEFKVRLRPSRG